MSIEEDNTRSLESLLTQTTIPVLIVDESEKYVEANRAALRFLECTREDLIGKSIWDTVNPRLLEPRSEDNHFFTSSKPFEIDFLVGYSVKTLLLYVTPQPFDGQKVFIGIGQDITHHKQIEQKMLNVNRLYSLLSNINHSIVRIKTPQQLFDEICRITVEVGKFQMAVIFNENSPDGRILPVAYFGIRKEHEDFVHNLESDQRSTQLSVIADSIYHNKLAVFNNIDEEFEPGFLRDQAIKLDFHSLAVIPIWVDGHAAYTLSIFSEKHDFFVDETSLLEELKDDLSFALQTMEIESGKKLAEDTLVQTNRILRAVRSVNQLITQAEDEQSLLESSCRCLLEIPGFSYFCAFQLDENQKPVSFAHSETGDKFKHLEELIKKNPFSNCFNLAFNTRCPVVAGEGDRICRDCIRKLKIQSGSHIVTIPMISSDRIQGILTCLAEKDFKVTREHIGLLQELANDLGFALNNIHLKKIRLDTERQLEASEKKFRALFEQSIEGIMLVDPEDNILAYNNAHVKLTGYTREEVVGIGRQGVPWDVYEGRWHTTREEKAALYKNLVKTIKARSPGSVGDSSEVIIRRKDREIRTLLFNSSFIDLGDTFIICLVAKDVTDQKRAEAALKYQAMLVDNVSDAIISTDLDSIILSWNKAAEKIYGWRQEEVLGKNILALLSPGFPLDNGPDLVKKILESGQVVQEFAHTRKDGTQVHVLSSSSLIKDLSGEVTGVIGVFHDISGMKNAAEKLEQLYEKEKAQREELQEEAKARGLFIEVLAHELRTPLTPILASIGMLQEIVEASPYEIEKKLTANISSGAQTLSKRLEELLDVARYSRGTFSLNYMPVDIHRFIDEVVSRFEPSIKQRKQQLIISIPDQLPSVQADPSRLEQVITNLLSNASKFSLDSGNIFLKVSLEDADLLVEVRDEGIGITSEEQDRLFQPYHRVEQDRQKFPGIGLGLAVARQIIEAHHGRIWVTSDSGQGSTFSFTLPLRNS